MENEKVCKICGSEDVYVSIQAGFLPDYYLCEDCENDISYYQFELEDE